MSATILLTNDDGIHSPGIQSLREPLEREWEVYLVAPESEQSAASHALTLNRPLRVRTVDERTRAIDGTPADCVMLSLKGLLEIHPDLVISGINNGPNLGDDVIYSGTVAGAREATILGIPAMAVSFADPEINDIELGIDVTMKVARKVLKYGLPEGVFLNINIPGSWSGTRFEITTLGTRTYREVIVEKFDPRGKPYYWIGGQAEAWAGGDSSDFAAIERGNVSITPLHLDMTARHAIDSFIAWNW